MQIACCHGIVCICENIETIATSEGYASGGRLCDFCEDLILHQRVSLSFGKVL